MTNTTTTHASPASTAQASAIRIGSCEIKRPNYRIYDRTGGGATKDIYAVDLDAAIAQGRAWIEDGDWSDYQGPLDCSVREIVWVPDLHSIDAVMTGSLRSGVVPMMIDEGATRNGDAHDCSGYAETEEPECEDGEHDWSDDFEAVGGILQNPGVWSSGHGRLKYLHCCAECGQYRTTDHGASRQDTGERMTKVTYEEADEKSLAWVAEQKEGK